MARRPPDAANETLGVRVWRWPASSPEDVARNPDWAGSLGEWVVEADLGVFSPVCTQWYAGLVHLRDVPNQSRPPYRQFPGAEFEFLLFAADPNKAFDLVELYDARRAGTAPEYAGFLLTPPDITYQWTGTTDAQAIQVVEAFVRAALAGESIDRPVQDGAAAMLAYDLMWGSLLAGTVAHFTEGHA